MTINEQVSLMGRLIDAGFCISTLYEQFRIQLNFSAIVNARISGGRSRDAAVNRTRARARHFQEVMHKLAKESSMANSPATSGANHSDQNRDYHWGSNVQPAARPR